MDVISSRLAMQGRPRRELSNDFKSPIRPTDGYVKAITLTSI